MNILLVDDDIKIFNLITVFKNEDEYFYFVKTIKEAKKFINENHIDFMLLDINLIDESGLDYFVSHHKEIFEKNIQVVLLSQESGLKEKIEAFTLGAVDYIEKPFEPLELLFRLRSHYKRKNDSKLFKKVEDVYFDLGNMNVFLLKNNDKVKIDLTPIEFSLLLCLVSQFEHALDRHKIKDTVWGSKTSISERVIDQHIYRLREKIEKSKIEIKTVFGHGYIAKKKAS